MFVIEGKNNKCTNIVCASLLHIFPYLTTYHLLHNTLRFFVLGTTSVNFYFFQQSQMHIHSLAQNLGVFGVIFEKNLHRFSIFYTFLNVKILNFFKFFQKKIYFFRLFRKKSEYFLIFAIFQLKSSKNRGVSCNTYIPLYKESEPPGRPQRVNTLQKGIGHDS